MPMAATPRCFAAIAAGLLLTGVACAGSTDFDSGPSTSARNKNVTAPMLRLKIPPRNRKGELIVASQRPDFDGLRVILGNCTTVKTYREWTVPFPDGAKRAQKQRPAAKYNELFAPGNETQFPAIDFWTNTGFNWRRTRLDARAWEQLLPRTWRGIGDEPVLAHADGAEVAVGWNTYGLSMRAGRRAMKLC